MAEVESRHVHLRDQREEAEAKISQAKRGLRGVLKELRALHEEEGLDSDWEEEEAICAICADGQATDENDIAVCDKCYVPFHQQCHAPALKAKDLGDEEDEWWCHRCDLVYDHLSNAILDAYGVDEDRRRTFRKVESLLAPSEGEEEDDDDDEEEEEGGRERGRGGGGGRGKEDSDEEDDEDYETEESEESSDGNSDNDDDDDSEEEEEEDGSGSDYGSEEESDSGSGGGGGGGGHGSSYHSSEDSDFDSDGSSYNSSDSFDSDFY